MGTTLRSFLWLSILLLIGPIPLSGQSVVVLVTQEETGQPVSGALLSLLGEDGALIRNALTNAQGRFLFRLGAPGSFTVRAEMIGRESVEDSGEVLQEGSTVNLHLQLPVNAIPLEGIEVQAEGRCRLRPHEASEIFLVWEEARKALEAQRWTEKTEFYRYQIVSYDRNLDPDTHRILSEDRRVKTSVTQIPVQSLPPGQLLTKGFVHPLEDGGHMYYGPDATVLLSDQFLDTHCFRLRARPEDPGQIGLGFEPVQVNDRPEIEGTFWLDRETAELQFLEFRYTWSAAREARGVGGGRVEFQSMPNGAWIVSKWWIRMPRLERAPVLAGSDRSGIRLFGVKETGAEISVGSTVDSARLSEAVPGALRGTVWDSVRSAPLAGAHVFLSGTQFSTRSDSLGRFHLGGVREGVFTTSFTHPRLDTLGVRVTGIDVEVSPGSLMEVDLYVPSWPAVLASACGEEGRLGSAVLKGEVRDETSGDPVPGAEVRIEWQGGAQQLSERVFRGRDHWFTTTTNSAGRFKACGIPLGEVVELGASFSDHESETIRLQIPAEDVRTVDLSLTLPAESPSSHPEPAVAETGTIQAVGSSSGPMNVAGKVVDAGSELPVPNPTIVLEDSLGQVLLTAHGNEQGNFQVRPPAPGKYHLHVSSLGYASAEIALTVLHDQSLILRVPLQVQPVELSGIEARVQPTPRFGGMTIAGFRARQATGIGTFFDESDIDQRKPSRVTDLVSRTPGLNVLRSGGGAVDVVSQRSMGGFRGDAPCLPEIWLDGLRVREGGFHSASRRSGTLFLNDVISPEQIAGIEVYPGVAQIPAQFRGPTAMCGAVVIWSRRGGEGPPIPEPPGPD